MIQQNQDFASLKPIRFMISQESRYCKIMVDTPNSSWFLPIPSMQEVSYVYNNKADPELNKWGNLITKDINHHVLTFFFNKIMDIPLFKRFTVKTSNRCIFTLKILTYNLSRYFKMVYVMLSCLHKSYQPLPYYLRAHTTYCKMIMEQNKT